VDGVGHHLLAGPALAVDQHAGVGVGHHLDQLEDALHLLALADDLGEGVAALQLLLQAHVLLAKQADGADILQADEELIHPERLGDEVGRAMSHGLHGPLHRSVSRDHHDSAPGIRRLDPAQQLHAVHARHDQIDKSQLRSVLLEHRLAMDPVLGDIDDPPLLAQRIRDGHAE